LVEPLVGDDSVTDPDSTPITSEESLNLVASAAMFSADRLGNTRDDELGNIFPLCISGLKWH